LRSSATSSSAKRCRCAFSRDNSPACCTRSATRGLARGHTRLQYAT
jgi:hypothetical protein